MRFQDIPGQEEIKQKLRDALKRDHVAHAQLFAGPDGSPNLAMALAFATYLNCANRTETDACGECPSCVKNAKLVHPDLHFIFPTSATPKFKREDATSDKFLTEWRSFVLSMPYGNVTDWSFHFGWENKQVIIPRKESRNIINSLALKSFEGSYKIMLVWLPELMNVNAANGILKILEEPPEKTIFLMVSNDANRLLTTIISRTQILRIPAFTDEEIKESLEAKEGLSLEKIGQIAYLAEGNLRVATHLADGDVNEVQELFKNWMRLCFTWDFKGMTKMADDFQKSGKEQQKSLFNAGTKVLRDTLINQFEAKDLMRVPDSEAGFIQNFGKVFNPEKIAMVTPKLEEAHYHIERNANAKILFLDLSLSIAQIARSN
ncbi:MAG: DNA polymerase III subunit delta [Roseivirga sp.]|nr:DNA polymerase III subunit delta [Roseivirga sp.]